MLTFQTVPSNFKSMMLSLVRFYLLLQLVSCKVDTSRWVGLTHPLSPEGSVYSMVYTPMKVDNERSKHTSSWPGTDLDGVFVAFRYIEFYEHTGTHVDAPIHFDENGKTEDQLTWEELTGPLNIVDVRHKIDGKNQMIVTADDFNLFVEMHGPIEPHAFVIVHSGWSQYFFSDKKTYEDNATCLDESAIDWLIENAPDMKGFGMEALSPECNKEGLMFRLHRLLLPQGKLIIENVGTGLEKLPPKGADLMLFPMHLKDGTGSPVRLVAVWSGASRISVHAIMIFELFMSFVVRL